VGLIPHGTLVAVLLCIGAAMGPAISCQPADTCSRWCITLEGLAATTAAMMDAVVAKALALGAHVLASEGLLWPTATQLALLSLVQFDAA
jgi:hypothetical protein